MRIILVYNFCHTVHCHAPQAASRRQPASCPLKEPLCCHRPCQALCLLLRWTPLARPPFTPSPPPHPPPPPPPAPPPPRPPPRPPARRAGAPGRGGRRGGPPRHHRQRAHSARRPTGAAGQHRHPERTAQRHQLHLADGEGPTG